MCAHVVKSVECVYLVGVILTLQYRGWTPILYEGDANITPRLLAINCWETARVRKVLVREEARKHDGINMMIRYRTIEPIRRDESLKAGGGGGGRLRRG